MEAVKSICCAQGEPNYRTQPAYFNKDLQLGVVYIAHGHAIKYVFMIMK